MFDVRCSIRTCSLSLSLCVFEWEKFAAAATSQPCAERSSPGIAQFFSAAQHRRRRTHNGSRLLTPQLRQLNRRRDSLTALSMQLPATTGEGAALLRFETAGRGALSPRVLPQRTWRATHLRRPGHLQINKLSGASPQLILKPTAHRSGTNNKSNIDCLIHSSSEAAGRWSRLLQEASPCSEHSVHLFNRTQLKM